jgi:hypothetical protein
MLTSKQAITILHEQIINLLIDNHPEGGNLRCALINDWIIEHDGRLITIRGHAEDPVPPKSPPWLVFEHDSDTDNFTVSTELEPYLYDIIGLLLEAWRIKLESPNHGSEYHIRSAIERIAARWKSQNEPISERDQKALIGELKCVIDASSINGLEAVESWDSTGHALYDLESENWIIESKATSTEPEIVSVSYPEQVDYRIDKILVLGVTKLNKNSKNGKTFPEFINECLLSLHTSHAQKLETLLIGRGYNKSMSEKFRTKWQIHGTRYLRITEDSPVLPCSILENIPLTIRKIRYDLNTSNFTDEDLSMIIGV